MVRSIYEITECPQCASQNIIHNAKSMQIICKDCGLIYDPLKPVKNVGLVVSAAPANSERIIRPVEKAQKKPLKAQKKAPAKARPKKQAKKPKSSPKPKVKKGLGGKIKGFVKKLMKKKR